MPEQLSHSLGKLVRALGIPMADRHRASGDNGDSEVIQNAFGQRFRKIIKDFIKFKIEKV
jgi:DNA polymerase-3 subunit epsilon